MELGSALQYYQKMNIFEGARRITKVIAVMIVVGFGYAIFTEQADTVPLSYLSSGPEKTMARIDECSVVDSSLPFKFVLLPRMRQSKNMRCGS